MKKYNCNFISDDRDGTGSSCAWTMTDYQNKLHNGKLILQSESQGNQVRIRLTPYLGRALSTEKFGIEVWPNGQLRTND